MLQTATFSGNQRPDLLTALMNMSLVLRLPRKMHLCRSSWNAPRLPSFLEMPQNPHVLLTFDKVHNPLRLPRETTSERQKVVRKFGAFYILTSKCALRHNGLQFFDISTSKSGLRMVCLYILTLKWASRHNAVQFFISHLASWLRTRRFSEPTFRPSGATKHWKNTLVSRLSYLFAHLDLISSETFSFLIFFLLLFSSLLWLFPSLLFICPYSLTSKLPSIIVIYIYTHNMQICIMFHHSNVFFPIQDRDFPLPCLILRGHQRLQPRELWTSRLLLKLLIFEPWAPRELCRPSSAAIWHIESHHSGNSLGTWRQNALVQTSRLQVSQWLQWNTTIETCIFDVFSPKKTKNLKDCFFF